ncbi:MAG TPA: DUF2513 domain-containing protein [Verrucomicrobiae bacterium]
MKRDMELVRLLLLQEETGEAPPELSEYSTETLIYNYQIMDDAGLIVANFTKDSSGVAAGATVYRLTWAGHDFLDATRDSKIWKMAKEQILKPGGSWTFSILLEWLKQEAQKRILGVPQIG